MSSALGYSAVKVHVQVYAAALCFVTLTFLLEGLVEGYSVAICLCIYQHSVTVKEQGLWQAQCSCSLRS